MRLLIVIGLLLLQDQSKVPSVPPPPDSGSNHKPEDVDAHELPSKQQGEVRPQESQSTTGPLVAGTARVQAAPSVGVHLVAPHNPGKPISLESTANWQSSAAALRLLHVPYGQWVEIEGMWHHHRPKTPMETILVEFQPLGEKGQTPLPTVVVRFGRDPSDVRVGKNTFSKQVTLLPQQSVELDYMREFGDGRPEAPPEKRFEAAGYSVGQIAPATIPAASSSTIKETESKPCAGGTSNQDNCSKLEFEPIATSSFTVRTAASEISSITPPATAWLRLSADKKALAVLVKECQLSAAIAEVTFTTALKGLDYKPQHHFRNIRFGLELRNGSLSNDKATAEVWLTNDSLSKLVRDHSELREFLLEAAPVTNREVNVTLHLIDPKIVFNNGLLQDGMVEYPLGKNVELNLKLPRPQ